MGGRARTGLVYHSRFPGCEMLSESNSGRETIRPGTTKLYELIHRLHSTFP